MNYILIFLVLAVIYLELQPRIDISDTGTVRIWYNVSTQYYMRRHITLLTLPTWLNDWRLKRKKMPL